MVYALASGAFCFTRLVWQVRVAFLFDPFVYLMSLKCDEGGGRKEGLDWFPKECLGVS